MSSGLPSDKYQVIGKKYGCGLWLEKRPYPYSHGWTGTSIELNPVPGISFEFETISPHKPLLHVSASPTVRIRISSISKLR